MLARVIGPVIAASSPRRPPSSWNRRTLQRERRNWKAELVCDESSCRLGGETWRQLGRGLVDFVHGALCDCPDAQLRRGRKLDRRPRLEIALRRAEYFATRHGFRDLIEKDEGG
jgi:hypothetical protein